METCEELSQKNIDNIIQKSQFVKFECEECVKVKSWWVHLRICQECGKMLCCDSSPNQHARKHYEQTKHPVISSAEMGEKWLYCFDHDFTKQY
jgi:uncharacterized UBP type Zn finger protein